MNINFNCNLDLRATGLSLFTFMCYPKKSSCYLCLENHDSRIIEIKESFMMSDSYKVSFCVFLFVLEFQR